MKKYKLGQLVYVVEVYEDRIIAGGIESIKTTKYNSSNTGKSEFVQYYVKGGWYYSDECYSKKEQASSALVEKLRSKIESIESKIRRVVSIE